MRQYIMLALLLTYGCHMLQVASSQTTEMNSMETTTGNSLGGLLGRVRKRISQGGGLFNSLQNPRQILTDTAKAVLNGSPGGETTTIPTTTETSSETPTTSEATTRETAEPFLQPLIPQISEGIKNFTNNLLKPSKNSTAPSETTSGVEPTIPSVFPNIFNSSSNGITHPLNIPKQIQNNVMNLMRPSASMTDVIRNTMDIVRKMMTMFSDTLTDAANSLMKDLPSIAQQVQKDVANVFQTAPVDSSFLVILTLLVRIIRDAARNYIERYMQPIVNVMDAAHHVLRLLHLM